MPKHAEIIMNKQDLIGHKDGLWETDFREVLMKNAGRSYEELNIHH